MAARVRSVGTLWLVLVGVGLIASGAFAMFFTRVFFGAIGLVENVLPIPANSTLAAAYSQYVEPSILLFIQVASIVMEITGIVVLVRALWSMLPFGT